VTKTIKHVKPQSMGHLHLVFEDGTAETLVRGTHEELGLKAGDVWPMPVGEGVPCNLLSAEPLNFLPPFVAPPEVVSSDVPPKGESIFAPGEGVPGNLLSAEEK
jgi:hypothetical protein